MALPDQVNGSENGDRAATYRGARIPQHVVYRSLVSETVMLNIQTGKYYGLNQTAGRMLEFVEQRAELEDMVAELAREFDAPEDTVRDDFLSLCSDLAEKGLIEVELPDLAQGARPGDPDVFHP